MAGYSAQVKRDRDRSADAAEAQLIAETLQQLQHELGAARLAELMQLGAAMSGADVLALALPA